MGIKLIKLPNFVAIGSSMGRTIEETWRFSHHHRFVMRMFGPPTKAFGGLYHCAKFGWNRCGNFEYFASWAWKRLFTPS